MRPQKCLIVYETFTKNAALTHQYENQSRCQFPLNISESTAKCSTFVETSIVEQIESYKKVPTKKAISSLGAEIFAKLGQ